MSVDDQLIAMVQAANCKLLQLAIERQRKADYRKRLWAAIDQLREPT